jgi:hypothetical protein
MQDTTENERKHHTPIIKEKEFKPNKSKLLLFSFLLNTKQTQAITQFARQKEQRKP